MTFLKKLGEFLLKGAALASGILPLVQPLLGSGKASLIMTTGVNDLNLITQQVVTIEVALNGKTGAEKFAALVPLVAGIVRTSEMVSGKKIGNEDLFNKAVTELAQGAVDLYNSIHPDEVKTA